MESMKISIIVPIYNAEIYLQECINTIIGQTYRNIEIILVDDGSTDRSPEICDEFANMDHRIVVVHQKNSGVAIARNTGLKCVTGEVIAFIDSDDFINTKMYEKMINIMVSTQADIVICGYYTGANSNEALYENYHDCTLTSYEALQLLLEDRFVRNQLWSMIFKRDLFRDIEFPEKKVYEDVRIIYKLFLNSRKISIIQDNLYFYRYLETSLSHEVNIGRGLDLLVAFKEQQQGVGKVYPDLEGICMIRQMEYCLKFALHLCRDNAHKINNDGIVFISNARKIMIELTIGIFKNKYKMRYLKFVKLSLKIIYYSTMIQVDHIKTRLLRRGK